MREVEKMSLLGLLADGHFHSGAELGRDLGISRAAIWKQVSVLRRRGLAVDVVRGKGYRLQTAHESWSQAELMAHLSPPIAALVQTLKVERQVASTNDVVADLMSSLGSGVICIAEEQTAGRGRRGRSWLSPMGQNFYGSIGWCFPGGIQAVEGLSLAVGVALVRALRSYGCETVMLKWPNDLVIGECKLGGVLIEMQAEAGGHCNVVIGIGLNLFLAPEASEQLGRPVTDLSSNIARPIARNELGAMVLEEVIRLLCTYEVDGFQSVQLEWMSYDSLNGAEVVATGVEKNVIGLARGVDLHGALLIEAAGEMVVLHGGEVSLRGRR